MREKKIFYRERIWECGCYTEVEVFPVFQKPGVRRSKCKPSSEVQKRMNQKNAQKKYTRLVHLNFIENDHAIGLDYSENCIPDNDEQYKVDIKNWLRRIKRLYKRYGEILKYIVVFEQSDNGAPHFHININKTSVPEELIRKKWTLGRTEVEPLQFDETGVVGWCKYTTKSKYFSKRWFASKNLKQPEPKSVKDYAFPKKLVDSLRIEDMDVIHRKYGENMQLIKCVIENNEINRADYINIQLFDLEKHIRLTGKKRYERKIRNDKSAVRTGAQKINC